MAFRKLTALSLTDLFVNEIEKMILSGELKIGEKMPPERQLAEEMKVSLAVINAGVTRLTSLGFLRIVPRKGVVVGPSGSGKTMSYAEMCLLKTSNSSLIVTLSKRKLVHKYLSCYRNKGYKVYDLNLTEPDAGNVSYDPLYYVKNTADITYIARSIVMANPKKNESKEADPFWDDAAQSLLSALIAYEMHIKTKPTFADVLDLFGKLHIVDKGDKIETNLDSLFDRLNKEEPDCFAYQCWKTFRFSPMRTASCIYSALNVTLDTIFRPE